MLISTFAAIALAGSNAPVIYRSDDIAVALKAGCSVQQVHTPAGKTGSQRAILRCPAPVERLERAARG